ncbi:hypothetical protein Lal_00033457 [Lupinus albus]|nr:hypothetical protein Lal_00033457 [Lupinus albus]
MSSQNEVNEEGTMVNTQTPITQTPEPQTPQTQTQKRKPRGITAMKSVVRSRSNDNKLTVEWNAKGQPLNNKGGKKLVSYIGVVVRQNISIKFKHWSDDRLNAAKDIIWKDITATFDVGEEHKDYIMKSVGKALREFRTNCGKCLRDAEGNVNLKPPAKYANLIEEVDWIEFVTYRTQDEKFLAIYNVNVDFEFFGVIYNLEQSETPSPSSATIDLDVLWVDARKNKQGVIDNEKVQEVVNRVALGLPRYLGRIRSVGFGASIQFLPQSAKRLSKENATVLLNKYDLLAERFQAMEKRMEAGKFVEGPKASTIVKESFTHPSNHIPILDGIINNCKLFLDTQCIRAVEIGTVYNTQDAIIHHAKIPLNHLKVSIDISIEDDALLPIPVEEDIITVGLALATFVAWPKHLKDVVPIMGKVSANDHSATSPPIIDEPASKKAKVVKSKPQSSKSNLESLGENLPAGSTINISFPEPIYGFPTKEFIAPTDVKDVHGRDLIGASVLSVYIRYLFDNFVPKCKKKVVFISPQASILGVGMVPNDTWKKQQSEEIAKILDENEEIADLFFASLNTGALNTYRALNPKCQNPPSGFMLSEVIYFRYGREDPKFVTTNKLMISSTA